MTRKREPIPQPPLEDESLVVSVGDALLRQAEATSLIEINNNTARWFAALIDDPTTVPLPHNRLPNAATREAVAALLRVAESTGHSEDVKSAMQIALSRPDSLTPANWRRLFPDQAAWEYYSEDVVDPETVPENVSIVETDRGKFRVITGAHIFRQDPSDLGLNYSGTLLESGTADYLTSEGLDAFIEQASLGSEKLQNLDRDQYVDVMKRSAEDGRPIYLADVNDADVLVILMQAPKVAEGLMGMGIAGAALVEANRVRKKHQQEPLSRRDFLRLATAGTAIATTVPYLTGPALIENVFMAQHLTGQKLSKEKMRQVIEDHPEIYALAVTLRNYIMASKLEAIRQHDPDAFPDGELAIILGAGHFGVEDALRMDPAQRTKAIEELLRYAPMIDREQLTKVVRLDFNHATQRWGKTDTFEDDKLKPTTSI